MPILFVLLIVFVGIVLLPFAGVFALNLLGLSIPYTINTWGGMLILMVLFGGSTKVGKKD